MSIFLCFVSLLSLFFTSSPSSPDVRKLPHFELRLIDGTILRSKDLNGKVTIIDFWGTWCPPCLAEIPEYNVFYGEYRKKGVGFYGLAVDSGTEREVRAAAARLKIRYPVAVPSAAQLDALGDFPVFPTTWVIDRRGIIVKEFLGSTPKKLTLLREIVSHILKEPPG